MARITGDRSGARALRRAAPLALAFLLVHAAGVGAGEAGEGSPEKRGKPVPPTGAYVLTNTHNWVTVEGKRLDLFPLAPHGLTNYGHWREVEPQRGEYRWRGFLRLMDESRRAGKKLAYGVLAGTHAPDWAMALPGVLTWESTYPDGRTRVTPLPWMEKEGRRVLNEPLLAAWKETVTAFARVVREQPDYRERIAYIPITGGPSTNGLEIMWAAHRYEEFAQLRWGAAEDALLAEYWKRCVVIFMEAFPDLPLGLAITDYIGLLPSGQHRRTLGVAKSVCDFAVEEAGRRRALFLPMGLWVGAGESLLSLEHPLTRLLFSYAPRCPIGLQGPLRTPDAAYLEKMLRFGADAGASWIELWHADFLEARYRPVVAEWARRYGAKQQ